MAVVASPIAGLHPLEYEHPLDTRAIESLRGVPGLDKLVKLFISQGVGKYFEVECTGSNIRVNEKAYPELHRLLLDACAILNVAQPPTLYIEQDDHINAYVVGDERHLLCVTAGAVDRLTEPELMCLFGHELGHIKSQHVLYRMIAGSLAGLGTGLAKYTFGASLVLSALSTPVEMGLLRWERTSELTCDRAGLLSCQNLDACMGLFMKMAGLPHKYAQAPHVEEFVAQAREFDQADYGVISKFIKWAQASTMTHPFTVIRAAEILKWVESGEYEQVLNRKSSRRIGVKLIDGLELCRTCNYRLSGTEKFCPCCGGNIA